MMSGRPVVVGGASALRLLGSPRSFFAPADLVSGEETFQHDLHGPTFLGIEVDSRLEGKPECLIVGESGIIAEDQRVRAHREGDGQAPQDAERRFRRSRLVALELGDMDAGPLGHRVLGEAACTTESSEPFGEVHGRNPTPEGVDHIE